MATIKCCLNGDRVGPGIPSTPAELAAEAAAVQMLGATIVHVHPRSGDRESLAWDDIRAAIQAIRDRCPGLIVGVSTREEIEPDADLRLAALTHWQGPPEGPDLASVNWHEDRAEAVADLLADKGIGIEAGLFTADAARKLGRRTGLARVLVEALPGISPGADGVDAARRILAAVEVRDTDLVVHGEQEWAWPVLWWSLQNAHGIRVGFEDMPSGPDGEQAGSNADLLRMARRPAGSDG